MKSLCAKTCRILSTKEHKGNHLILDGNTQLFRHSLGDGRREDSSSLCSLCSFVANLLVVFTAFVTFPATAQIQQAWVAHYNNGITNGTNQAVKMALDAAGNIYVTGFSQNTNTNLGYVTIKYAPNGNQVWASRYDATNFPNATPTALLLDSNNDVIVTGSAMTVKYDPNGNQLWTAPYAGLAMAGDSFGDAYVTGFSSNFNIVKIAPTGSNLWINGYQDVGPTIGQMIAVDSTGNAYVCGSDAYYKYSYDANQIGYYVGLLSIKYNSNGNQLWLAKYQNGITPGVQVGGVALDNSNNLYCVADFTFTQGYLTVNYGSTGDLNWGLAPIPNSSSIAHGLAPNQQGGVFLTGLIPYAQVQGGYKYYCATFELNASGTVWTNNYPQTAVGSSAGNAISVDSANNSYVTGYSPGTNSLNDIVTIKYGPNGNQVWLQRYNGPGNGNDAGNAIAVDYNGNVYVAGYDTTTAGGTEMVLIKYSPVTVQKRADGSILLQAQGSPGENFDIQASPDLLNWLDLGIVTADTNGLMQYDDTNAANFPSRFYYTNPQ